VGAYSYMTKLLDRFSKLLLIRANERGTVVYFFALYVFVGIGLAIGRSTADALFLKRFGIEYLPVMYLILSIVLMIFSTLYAAFSDRFSPEKMFRIIYGGIGILLVCNWLFIVFSDSNMGYPIYFLIYEASSEILLVHASLYLGKNLEVQQLKRISSVIFSGAQIGIIIGGLFLAGTADIIGVQNMLLVWVATISVSGIMIILRHRRTGPSLFFRSQVKSRNIIQQSFKDIKEGLAFAKHSPLLRTICFAMFFMVIGYFTLSYSVNRVYNATFTTEESLSAFFGILNASCSFAALVLQLLVTNRLLQRFGLKVSNLIYPVTTLLSFVFLLFSFTVPSAIFASINRDTLTPAIRTPVRNIFFNALPDYMQGRARALAIAVVMPLALIVTGSLLILSQSVNQPGLFLMIGIASAFGYLFSNIRMNRSYINSIINVLTEKLYLPDRHFDSSIIRRDKRLIDELNKGLHHDDADISISYAKLFIKIDPDNASEKILLRAEGETDNDISTKLLRLLRHVDTHNLEDQLLDSFDKATELRRYTLLTILLSNNTDSVREQGLACINETHPTAQIAGIVAAFRFGNTQQQDIAHHKWKALLAGQDILHVGAGLEVCKIIGEAPVEELVEVLAHEDETIRQRALSIIHKNLQQPHDLLCEGVSKLTHDPIASIRTRAYDCLTTHWNDTAQEVAEKALEDEHPTVRSAGINILFDESDEGLAVLKAWVIGNAGSPRAQRTAFESLAERSNETVLWESVANTRIDDARKFSHAIQVLRNSNTSTSSMLMLHLLEERLKQTIDLAIMAMAQFEDKTTIDVIRACLSGGDRQHIAHASEILCNLENSQAQALSRVLELAYSKTNIEISNCIFTSILEVIAWCHSRSDRWLVECARYTAKQSGLKV